MNYCDLKISSKETKSKNQLNILFAYQAKNDKKDSSSQLEPHCLKNPILKHYVSLSHGKNYSGSFGDNKLHSFDDQSYLLVGLGPSKELTLEKLRRVAAHIYKWGEEYKQDSIELSLDDVTIVKSDYAKISYAFLEGFFLSQYKFDQFLKKKKPRSLKTLHIVAEKATNIKTLKDNLQKVEVVTESIDFCRMLTDLPPNILNSESMANMIDNDCKKNLKRVKIKILGKAEIKKENMNLFLSVNAGSNYEPRFVHLTYSPKQKSKGHIALVGKGITFDTGGYSIKPGDAMMTMKDDMCGAATMYASFRAAALLDSPYTLSCILPLTDNAINSVATKPDSIIVGRSGTSVEILNTDAEGRLILADALDYACDLKPDKIFDAATLTGAVLIALGKEVTGLMSNNQDFANEFLEVARNQAEYVWQLPIVEEYRQDMRTSKNADLSNIGTGRFAGSSKAAAFMLEFIKNDIPWIHLDIAGTTTDQKHLPYCPSKGASGLTVRSVVSYITDGAI